MASGGATRSPHPAARRARETQTAAGFGDMVAPSQIDKTTEADTAPGRWEKSSGSFAVRRSTIGGKIISPAWRAVGAERTRAIWRTIHGRPAPQHPSGSSHPAQESAHFIPGGALPRARHRRQHG